LTDERCQELVRAALGVDDLPIAIENVMKWQATAECAERFQEGRIFLAGDAAHAMPPNGGFGGNTGIQDAHNLAWKLAQVLKRSAEPQLLDTYDAERRSVGAFTVEQAYSRYVTRWAPYLGTDNIAPMQNDPDIDLGYSYVAGDPLVSPVRETRGRPGTRAPHLWLDDGLSTLDLFGSNFVLLTGPQATDPLPDLKTKVNVHRITAAGFGEAYGIAPAGCVLVRPDGFVAWRSDQVSTSAILNALAANLLT
jgi:hypothetical protein